MGFLSKLWKKLTGWLKPDVPTQERGSNIEKNGTNQAIPVIYGFRKKAPCIKVFKATSDVSGGAKNEYLHLVCVFCVGEIEAIGSLYFNDQHESQIQQSDQVTIPLFGTNIVVGGNKYTAERYVGSSAQTASASLNAQISRWQSSAKLKNIAYVYVRLKQNKKTDWWQGEPKISADIYGLKVKDLRDNVVKYSNNPALCLYDYLTNTHYGKGLLASKLDTQAFIDAANFIETERTYTRTVYRTWYERESGTWLRVPVGTVNETVIENLMSCNVSLDNEKTLKENTETLLKGMRAILPETNGKYRVAIEKDDTPVFVFNKDNLIGAIQCQGGNQSERYNQVIIKFRNILTGEDDEAVYPADDALHQQWKAEDNDKLLVGEFTFETIDNKAEALQMGHVIAHRSRQLIGAMFTGMPETIVVEAGDVVTLDSQILGWNAKPFRIEAVNIDLTTGQVDFQAVEHQNSIYPWAIADASEDFVDTSFTLPSELHAPTGFAYTELTLDDPIQGYFSWDDPNDIMVTGYRFELYNQLSMLVFSADISDERLNITTIPTGTYTAKLFAKNALFYSGESTINVTITIAPLNSRYMWKAYAYDASGTGISLNSTGKKYIGWAVNKPTQTPDISDPSLYDWSLFVGADGVDGQTPVKGIDYFDGQNGIDGKPGGFTSFIFKNNPIRPATPTGGSFNGTAETFPTGWTDNETTPTWPSVTWYAKRRYEHDGTSWVGSTWSQPEKFYEKGADGVDGSNGQDGQRGAGTFTRTITGTTWSDAEALQAIIDVVGAGATPVVGDRVTLENLNAVSWFFSGFTETRQYTDSGTWVNFIAKFKWGSIIDPIQPIIEVSELPDINPLRNINLPLYDGAFESGTERWSASYTGKVVAEISSPNLIIVSSAGSVGGNVMRITNNLVFFAKDAMAIETNKKYRMKFRVRQTVDPTTAGLSKVYAGVACLDANYNQITQGAGTHRYFCVTGTIINVADGWQEFEGYIENEGDLYNNFKVGTAYIRPMFIVNYSGGNGTVEVDYISFERVTDEIELKDAGNWITIPEDGANKFEVIDDPVEGRFTFKTDVLPITYYDVFSPTERTKLDNLRNNKLPLDGTKTLNYWGHFSNVPTPLGAVTNSDSIKNTDIVLNTDGTLVDNAKNINLGVVTPTGIGAETPTGAQTKANAAQAAAESAAQVKANLAETQAKAYADGIVTAEEARAIADAQAKANLAETQAKAYADLKSSNQILYTTDNIATDLMPTGSPLAKGFIRSVSSSHYSSATDLIPVRRGETLFLEMWAKRDGSTARAYMGIERYDRNKKPISTNSGTVYTGLVNTPLTTSWVKYVGSTTLPITHTPYNGSDGLEVCYVRVRLLFNRVSDDTSYYSGFKLYRKVAWGDNLDGVPTQQYMPNVVSAGAGTALSANPLSAADVGTTATITIAAHTRQYGFGLISLNAGSIAGLAFSTKYYVYYDDPNYTGGAVSYQATTNLQTIAANNHRIYVSSITTPADGGSGTTPPPEFCVALSMFINEKNKAKQLTRGDKVDAWWGGEYSVIATVKQAQLIEQKQVVYEIETSSGAIVQISESTPLELQNHVCITPKELTVNRDKLATLKNKDKKLIWEIVTRCEIIGEKQVMHISIGNGSFAAGLDANNRIITHNAQVKP